ncbi:MAG: helix-turn-helix domain-containing protein [Patescibacteria group bacterium]
MMKVHELLQHFSLSPQEADLYLLLLRQGASSVTDLAHRQKKNRTAVRFHLNHLLERGLVKETRVGKRAEYVAMPPKELAALLERWTLDFKSFIPELESLQRTEQDKPILEVSESSAGYKRILDEISSMPHGAQFLVLEGKTAMGGEMRLLSNTDWELFFSRIIERKILTRAVFTEESLALPMKNLSESNKQLLKSRLWDLRTLPESTLPLEELVMIYGKKAAFVIPDIKLVFTLEHPGIVNILRALFETIHSLARPVSGGW